MCKKDFCVCFESTREREREEGREIVCVCVRKGYSLISLHKSKWMRRNGREREKGKRERERERERENGLPVVKLYTSFISDFVRSVSAHTSHLSFWSYCFHFLSLPVWPDLAQFRPLGDILKDLSNLMRANFVLGTILYLLWQKGLCDSAKFHWCKWPKLKT